MIRLANRLPCAAALAVTVVTSSAHAEGDFDPAEGRGGRIALETLAGTAAAAAGAALAGLAADKWWTDPKCRELGCLGNAFLVIASATVGGAALLAPGVTAAGHLSGANGKLWAAYAGEGLGLAAGLGVLAVDFRKTDLPEVVAAILLPIAGAVAGYELSTKATGGNAAQASQPVVRYALSF
jgi:hypothetical protein